MTRQRSDPPSTVRWYDRYILPRITHFACALKPHMRQRAKVVPRATGRVLEVGIGTGLNLPYYDATKVTKVWGLDPSPDMTRRALEAAAAAPFEVALLTESAEAIPLADGTVDTIVITYTLCSIPDPLTALREMRRVLRPDGRLRFCEHGAAPDASVRRWQNRLTPIWKRWAGGCHLNRGIPDLLARGGFRVTELETMYLPGWRPGSYNYWGAAQPSPDPSTPTTEPPSAGRAAPPPAEDAP